MSKNMIVAVALAAGLYVTVSLLFLVLSTTELLESGRDTRLRLLNAVFISACWPLAIVALSLLISMARHENMLKRVNHQPAF